MDSPTSSSNSTMTDANPNNMPPGLIVSITLTSVVIAAMIIIAALFKYGYLGPDSKPFRLPLKPKSKDPYGAASDMESGIDIPDGATSAKPNDGKSPLWGWPWWPFTPPRVRPSVPDHIPRPNMPGLYEHPSERGAYEMNLARNIPRSPTTSVRNRPESSVPRVPVPIRVPVPVSAQQERGRGRTPPPHPPPVTTVRTTPVSPIGSPKSSVPSPTGQERGRGKTSRR